MIRDPRIDAYIAKAQPFAQPILEHLRAAVHAGCPGVVETMKWSAPAFDHHGPLAVMAAFKAHCVINFWKGSLLGLEDRSSEAMGQFGRITSVKDLPPRKALVALVKRAARMNEEGVKTPRASKARPPEKVPADMTAALKKDRKALATFEAFSPTHRREYVEWITEPKTDATRQRRLETAMEWLAEGKHRNWKYERK